MERKIYYINRYDSSKRGQIRENSGYEQVVKYSDSFIEVSSNRYFSKLVLFLIGKKKPSNYFVLTAGEEVILFFKSIITGRPVFYLYADKDAFLLPLIKRKFNIKRIKLYGTLHWPIEISETFSFYKNDLATQFNGIITLSSSLHFSKSCVIPHGINTSFWKKDEGITFENSYLLLGISNRNHQGQIELVKKIKSIDPTSKFVLLMRNKQVYQHYKDVPDVEIIKTRISDQELRLLYAKSKAVILIQNYSLASNVVLECISTKTPLIANKIGDIEEYLGKDYPLLLDGISDEKILNAICYSHAFRKEVINYFDNIRDDFEWQAITNRTLDFIQKK